MVEKYLFVQVVLLTTFYLNKDTSDSRILTKHWLENNCKPVKSLNRLSKRGIIEGRERKNPAGPRQIADFLSK